MTSRNERIAEIEVLFRAGNDRMMAWPEYQERGSRGEELVLLCECGNRGCEHPLRVTARKYEQVRADARHFMIAAGHEQPEAEDVIERTDGFLVVQKHEDVRDLVERMNLRRAG